MIHVHLCLLLMTFLQSETYELFITFLLFVFRWFWLTKLQKCLFTFSKSLACLAFQTETIVKKVAQPKLPKTKIELAEICNEPGKKKIINIYFTHNYSIISILSRTVLRNGMQYLMIPTF